MDDLKTWSNAKLMGVMAFVVTNRDDTTQSSISRMMWSIRLVDLDNEKRRREEEIRRGETDDATAKRLIEEAFSGCSELPEDE